MKVVHFIYSTGHLRLNWEPIGDEWMVLRSQLLEPILPNLLEKYGARRYDMNYSLLLGLPVLLATLKGDLKGKKILDLGAGSTESTEDYGFENFASRTFEPWMSRILHELGVDVTAVDIGGLEKESFKSYSKLNLLEEGSLKMFSDDSFDLALASQLLDSPYLNQHFNGHFGRSPGRTLKENLEKQLERVLRPEGVFLYGPNEPY